MPNKKNARCSAPDRSEFARLRRRFSRGTTAGPIVEFAVVVPVLLILVLGVVDFGRAYFMQNSIVNAVREGARFAAVNSTPCTATTSIQHQVKLVMKGAGLDTSTVAPNVTYTLTSGTCGTAPNNVTNITVAITSYPYTAVTPLFRLINRTGSINLTAAAVFRWERAP